MWIAYYNNNKALPQYHPFTGEENLWDTIDQSKLVKFGLYPFNNKMAAILFKKGIIVNTKKLPKYEVEINDGKRLIHARRQYVQNFSYRVCNNCNNKWMAKDDDGLVVREPILVKGKDTFHISYKCPKCKKYNVEICPECRMNINKNYATLDEITKPIKDRKYIYRCDRCNIDYPRYITRHGSVNRYTIYLLGWQKTINGKNIKSIMFIDENGNMEMRDDD